MPALETLEQLFQQLDLIPAERRSRTPAFYLSELSCGPIVALQELDEPRALLVATDAGTDSVVLPAGMPMLQILQAGFEPAPAEPEPLMHMPEAYRMTQEFLDTNERKLRGYVPPRMITQAGDPGGVFVLPRQGLKSGFFFMVIADNGQQARRRGEAPTTYWEHVSVRPFDAGLQRTPTWEEMCYVKNLFWPKQAAVVQFHPAEQDYVNAHPHCLHLWRPLAVGFPQPDPTLVGPR